MAPSVAPRFVAYSTLTRRPVATGATAAGVLAETATVPALGSDNRFVEVLDCGADGPDAAAVDVPLDAARSLYRTVFRGSGALGRPGMPPLPLGAEPPDPRDAAAAQAIVEALAALVGRARAAGFERLAELLRAAHAAARDEVAARPGDA